MIPADDGERDDMAAIVEDFEPLVGDGGGEARDHADTPESADVSVAGDDVTAPDEVLVDLRSVKAADDGPDGVDWGADLLDHGRAALVATEGVGVVPGNFVGDFQLHGSGGGSGGRSVAEDSGGGGGGSRWRAGSRVGVDSVEHDAGFGGVDGWHGWGSVLFDLDEEFGRL